MLKMCLNIRVLAALGVVAAGIYLLAPGLFAVALPLLVLAVCPLSMLLMMHMMGGMGRMSDAAPAAEAGDRTYTCPMHPAVRNDEPGRCLSCGMGLQPIQRAAKPAQRAVGAVAASDALELQRRLDETAEEQARLSRELDALRAANAANRTDMLAAADRLEAEVDAALAEANQDAEAHDSAPGRPRWRGRQD